MVSSPIILKEHEGRKLDEQQHAILSKVSLCGMPDDYMGTPTKLGIQKSDDNSIRASYYIGTTWLDDTKTLPAFVTPKLDQDDIRVDFIEMFVTALNVDSLTEAEYFSKCYGISVDEPAIDTPSQITDILTPLLLLHYITLVRIAIKNGLKRDYISVEENLKGRVKGRLLIHRNLLFNEIQNRKDRIFCQYQEFSVNTPENRLLKKALIFAKTALRNFASSDHKSEITKHLQLIDTLLSYFKDVDDNVILSQISHTSHNKVYKNYTEAIRVAKLILRRYDYSLDKASSELNSNPPFWIDMPRLYELYVLKKLSETFPGKIEFQVEGHGYGNCRPTVDYIKKDNDPNLRYIIDAKYKTLYEQSLKLDDIRELSGYARDLTILKELGFKDTDAIPIVPCIIIHPSELTSEEDTDRLVYNLLQKKIRGYEQFYHFRLPCPNYKLKHK